MIICSECGRTLKKRYWNYGKPSQRVMQQCGSYIQGKANCNAKASRQDLIKATTIHMLNKVFLKDLDIMSSIQRVNKSTIKVDDVQGIIEKLTLERDENEIALSNLIDTKVKTPDIPESIFNTKYREYSDRLKVLTAEINKHELEHVKNYDTKKRMDKIGEILGKKNLVIDELDSEILSTFIYKMISVGPNEIVYCIAGTKNYSDNEFKERRFEFLKTEPIIVETYHAPDGLAKMLYRVVVI
jgi:hypothetical protein